MHIRYNDTAHYFEWDNGGTWEQLNLTGQTQIPTPDLSSVWPVGSIFITNRNNAGTPINPHDLLGFGTWVRAGNGCAIVGQDPNQTEFDGIEETGGAKTVTLTTNEMPGHAHPGSTVSTTINPSSHGHVQPPYNWDTQVASGSGSYKSEVHGSSGNAIQWGASVSLTATSTPTIASQGSGNAHNNLMPYITFYIWKRTA